MLGQAGQPSRAVMPVVSSVQYVDPGYLVFVREGTLLGQRLDLASGRVVGEPFSIAEPVRYFVSSAWAAFTASPNGVLAYESATIGRGSPGSTVPAAPGAASHGQQWVRISPDGPGPSSTAGRVRSLDLWTVDLGHQTETRLTSDPKRLRARGFQTKGRDLRARGGPPHCSGTSPRVAANCPAGPLQFVQDAA
jgi:hypothetical protein